MINPRKTAALLACLIVAGIAGGRQAAASTVSTTPNTVGVQIGALFPSSSSDRFVGGQTQLSAGLNYNMSMVGGSNPTGATDLYLDFMSGSDHSGYVHSGGLGVQFRSVGQGFIGAGVGLYNTAVRDPHGFSGNTTSAGGKVFAGLNLGGGSSVQVDYHIMPSTLGVNPSGLGLEVGFRL